MGHPCPVAAEGSSTSFNRQAGLEKLPALELAKGRQTELKTEMKNELRQEGTEEKLRVDIDAYTINKISTWLRTWIRSSMSFQGVWKLMVI